METRPRSTHLEGQLSVGQMKNDAAKATEPGTMSREPLSVHMRPTAQQTTVEGIFVRSLNNGRHQTAVQAAGCLRYRIRCLFQPVDKPVDQLCEVIGRDRSVWRPADCGRDGRVLLLAVGWLVARKLLTVAARLKCLQEIAVPDDTLEVEVVFAKRGDRTAAADWAQSRHDIQVDAGDAPQLALNRLDVARGGRKHPGRRKKIAEEKHLTRRPVPPQTNGGRVGDGQGLQSDAMGEDWHLRVRRIEQPPFLLAHEPDMSQASPFRPTRARRGGSWGQ